jgi:hypothetical protein
VYKRQTPCAPCLQEHTVRGYARNASRLAPNVLQSGWMNKNEVQNILTCQLALWCSVNGLLFMPILHLLARPISAQVLSEI